MNWSVIWQITFIAVVSVFALMSVLVTVLGARDIRTLLSRLKDDQKE